MSFVASSSKNFDINLAATVPELTESTSAPELHTPPIQHRKKLTRVKLCSSPSLPFRSQNVLYPVRKLFVLFFSNRVRVDRRPSTYTSYSHLQTYSRVKLRCPWPIAWQGMNRRVDLKRRRQRVPLSLLVTNRIQSTGIDSHHRDFAARRLRKPLTLKSSPYSDADQPSLQELDKCSRYDDHWDVLFWHCM